jgi:uncharacterized metal-binding protein
MTTEQKLTMVCDACRKRSCQYDYPDGIPNWCMATSFADVLESTRKEYSKSDTIDIYKAAGAVTTNGYGKWTRIQEAIEFAKELKLTKIGMASCGALFRELRMISELFTGAGFNVTSISCQVGKVSPEARGVPEMQGQRSTTCNPIAQAEILNNAGTQLNFLLGLCMGHDVLFNRYSKAPVSTLIVKDRITGHNPIAALYAGSHRRPLWKLYCGKDADAENC